MQGATGTVQGAQCKMLGAALSHASPCYHVPLSLDDRRLMFLLTGANHHLWNALPPILAWGCS